MSRATVAQRTSRPIEEGGDRQGAYSAVEIASGIHAASAFNPLSLPQLLNKTFLLQLGEETSVDEMFRLGDVLNRGGNGVFSPADRL
jgi:hypothetical protein